jgi:hypothetical protein
MGESGMKIEDTPDPCQWAEGEGTIRSEGTIPSKPEWYYKTQSELNSERLGRIELQLKEIIEKLDKIINL